MMKLQYFGKSCFSYLTDEVKILINPNFSKNEENFRNLDQIEADVIVLTKYCKKTFMDVITIAKFTKAKIICPASLACKLKEFGIEKEKIIKVCVGQRLNFEDKAYLHFVQSLSNSNLEGTLALGVIITINGTKVYYDGLTAYYSDLKLLEEYKIDYALLSVSEYGSKNIEDLKKTILDIKPKFFIPMNYKDEEVTQLLSFKDVIEKDVPSTIPVILPANSGIIITK